MLQTGSGPPAFPVRGLSSLPDLGENLVYQDRTESRRAVPRLVGSSVQGYNTTVTR